MSSKQGIIHQSNIHKSKIEVCCSTHLVPQRNLTFLRYIVLIPFSIAPLLNDSTHCSSNACFVGECLNKRPKVFIISTMHCIAIMLQAFDGARFRSWEAQWKYGALGASCRKCAAQRLCWPAVFSAPSYLWQSNTGSCAGSNIETISWQTDSPVVLLQSPYP